MMLKSVIWDEREDRQKWAIRAISIANVVTVEPRIVGPVIVRPRSFGCVGGRRPRSRGRVGGRRAGRRIATPIAWLDIDDREAASPFIPRELDAEYRICPDRIIKERLIVAHVALIEQKLHEGILDLVQFGLRQNPLVIDGDNRVGAQLPRWRRTR
jgi:hypothetical protein